MHSAMLNPPPPARHDWRRPPPCRLSAGASSRTLSPADGTVTIAYNVNLPSFDPTVGASAVNPTIQAMYPGGFRPLCRAGAEPQVQARAADQLGLERGQDESRDDGARGRHLARRATRSPPRTWSGRSNARATGETRQPDPVHLVENRQLQGRRQQDNRRRATSSSRRSSSGWPSSPATCCPRSITKSVGAEGFEAKSVGTGPYMVDSVPGQRLPSAQGQPELLRRQAGLRDRRLQIRPRSRQPGRRNRERVFRRHARDSLRGVRPAEVDARVSPATPRRSPTSG